MLMIHLPLSLPSHLILSCSLASLAHTPSPPWLHPSPHHDPSLPPPTAQKRLRDLKSRISAQSKKNFVLERDVRYLDSRIALLIQNRMAADEVSFYWEMSLRWDG